MHLIVMSHRADRDQEFGRQIITCVIERCINKILLQFAESGSSEIEFLQLDSRCTVISIWRLKQEIRLTLRICLRRESGREWERGSASDLTQLDAWDWN